MMTPPFLSYTIVIAQEMVHECQMKSYTKQKIDFELIKGYSRVAHTAEITAHSSNVIY